MKYLFQDKMFILFTGFFFLYISSLNEKELEEKIGSQTIFGKEISEQEQLKLLQKRFEKKGEHRNPRDLNPRSVT